MANRGRPKKITEDTNMNEEVDTLGVADTADVVDSAIGELSDSLQTDGEVKVLGAIVDITVESDEVVEDEADNEFDEEESPAFSEEMLNAPADDLILYALHYRDIREVGGGQFSFNLVATEDEAIAWCAKGPENREDRTYNKFKLIKIEE